MYQLVRMTMSSQRRYTRSGLDRSHRLVRTLLVTLSQTRSFDLLSKKCRTIFRRFALRSEFGISARPRFFSLYPSPPIIFPFSLFWMHALGSGQRASFMLHRLLS